MSVPADSMTIPMPDAAQVRELLGLLFDGLTVKPAAKLELSPKSGGYCALYLTDAGAPAAICGCDLAFAANGGAALSMLAPNVAKEAAKTKALTDVMLANLREVMNICTRLLLHDGSAHLRLDQVYEASAAPAAAAAIIGGAKRRADFEIGLGKYGSGLLSVLAG